MILNFNYASCLGNNKNTLYPHEAHVTNIDELKKVVERDYVLYKFKNNRRSINNFLYADYLAFDLDNDHSDEAKDWITTKDIKQAFPDVSFVAITSRHHNLVKGKRSARPRFHVIFEVDRINDAKELVDMIHKVNDIFPFFDTAAMDAGRFFYGSMNSKFVWFNGKRTLSDYLTEINTLDKSLKAFEEYLETGIPYQIIEGSRNKTLFAIARKLLVKYKNEDKAYNLFLKASTRCVPNLEDSEVNDIWKSALKYGYPLKNINVNTNEEAWDEPVSFKYVELPPFPIDDMPKPVIDYAKELSFALEVPLDMVCVPILGIMSSCIMGKYKVKPVSTWSENVNLYVVVVAEPGERKSPVLSNLVKPLKEYEAKWNKDHEFEIYSSTEEKEELKEKLEKIKKDVKNNKATKDDYINARIAYEKFKSVHKLRLTADDVTLEKLAELLAYYDEKITIISSEGGLFDIITGLYGDKQNLDILLKSYTGDNVLVDRVSRPSIILNHPLLTIVLMVQPKVIEGIMSNDLMRGRGLIGRFLYSYPQSKIGSRTLSLININSEFEENYKNTIFKLLDDKSKCFNLYLDDEALTIFNEFFNYLEIRHKKDFSEFVDWSSKLAGTALRIAAVISISEKSFEEDKLLSFDSALNPEKCINKSDITRAINIAKYFIEHAKYTFNVMNEDNTINNAKRILEWIKSLSLKEFSKRDIQRGIAKFKKAEEIDPAIIELINHAYIKEIKPPYSGNGRPQNAIYLVNPNWLKGSSNND